MPISRANAEAFLVGRCRGLLTLAAFSQTVLGQSAPNVDLSDPISESLQMCGITPLAFTQPVDADLALLTDYQVRKFLEIAELRLKINLHGSLLATPSQRADTSSQEFGQTIKGLEAEIARLQRLVIERYGPGSDYVQVEPMSVPAFSLGTWATGGPWPW